MAKQKRRSGRTGRSRSDWETLVGKFERSGLSRQQFCAEAAVPMSSLGYWQRKLRRERTTEASGFIELPAISSRSDWDIELELGGGVVLRLRRA